MRTPSQPEPAPAHAPEHDAPARGVVAVRPADSSLECTVEVRYGDRLEHTMINCAGDFLFIAPDVPHPPRDLSSTSPARALVARNTAAEQESVALVAKREG